MLKLKDVKISTRLRNVILKLVTGYQYPHELSNNHMDIVRNDLGIASPYLTFDEAQNFDLLNLRLIQEKNLYRLIGCAAVTRKELSELLK